MEIAELPTILPTIEPLAIFQKKPGKFTAEHAAAARAAKERLRLERLQALQHPQAAATPPDLDEFTKRRLLRVRDQLDIVDREVKRCLLSDDPEDLERVKPLVESSSRLSEQERFLANRPGPGTRKPQPVQSSHPESATIEED